MLCGDSPDLSCLGQALLLSLRLESRKYRSLALADSDSVTPESADSVPPTRRSGSDRGGFLQRRSGWSQQVPSWLEWREIPNAWGVLLSFLPPARSRPFSGNGPKSPTRQNCRRSVTRTRSRALDLVPCLFLSREHATPGSPRRSCASTVTAARRCAGADARCAVATTLLDLASCRCGHRVAVALVPFAIRWAAD